MFWNKFKRIPSKYFISIGAGVNQLPLIIEAKRAGFRVIGIDRDCGAPGFNICDLKIQESILDYEKIYETISEMMLDGIISGALARSYGGAVKSAAYLNEKFNAPFIPFIRSDDFINKRIMKSLFKSAAVRSPLIINFTAKSAEGYDPAQNPLIAKPALGHAKSGVRIIKEKNALLTAVKSPAYSKRELIIEEMITGDEIIAAGIICGGKYYLIEITDKITGPDGGFLDLVHSSPSKYISLSPEIQKIGQTTADAFQITSSPMIMEFIVSTKRELYLIEAVPEFGGEQLADILIPLKTKYNFFGQGVRAVASASFIPPQPVRNKGGFVIKYIPSRGGRFVSCDPEEARGVRGIEKVIILKKIGSALDDPVSNHDRVAVIAASGSDPEEALRRAEIAEEKLSIRIK